MALSFRRGAQGLARQLLPASSWGAQVASADVQQVLSGECRSPEGQRPTERADRPAPAPAALTLMPSPRYVFGLASFLGMPGVCVFGKPESNVQRYALEHPGQGCLSVKTCHFLFLVSNAPIPQPLPQPPYTAHCRPQQDPAAWHGQDVPQRGGHPSGQCSPPLRLASKGAVPDAQRHRISGASLSSPGLPAFPEPVRRCSEWSLLSCPCLVLPVSYHTSPCIPPHNSAGHKHFHPVSCDARHASCWRCCSCNSAFTNSWLGMACPEARAASSTRHGPDARQHPAYASPLCRLSKHPQATVDTLAGRPLSIWSIPSACASCC